MKEEPVHILARLLTDRGIDPDVRDTDIGFLHLSGGHAFKGQAGADADQASVEFWLFHFPRKNGGEAALQAKLEKVNENAAMSDEGIRWMRFIFNENHLGFVAQLNKRGKPFDEDIARSRLEVLMKLMEAELAGLLA